VLNHNNPLLLLFYFAARVVIRQKIGIIKSNSSKNVPKSTFYVGLDGIFWRTSGICMHEKHRQSS